MNWRNDASIYATSSGHEGRILNSFLDEHEDSMRAMEERIDSELSCYDAYKGIRFSMSGFIDSPMLTLDGYHDGAKITICDVPIDVEDPDWDATAQEFIEKWHDFEENDGAAKVNAWYDEQDKYGWD